MSKWVVFRTWYLKVRYCTLFWPKYPTCASASAGSAVSSERDKMARRAMTIMIPPGGPPRRLQRVYLRLVEQSAVQLRHFQMPATLPAPGGLVRRFLSSAAIAIAALYPPAAPVQAQAPAKGATDLDVFMER